MTKRTAGMTKKTAGMTKRSAGLKSGTAGMTGGTAGMTRTWRLFLVISFRSVISFFPVIPAEAGIHSFHRLVSLMPKTTIPTRSPTISSTSMLTPKTFVFEATWIRTILSSDSTFRLSALHSVLILGS